MRRSSSCSTRQVCASRLANGSVHQQHARLVGQDLGDLDALSHAAGQLARIFVALAEKADQRKVLFSDLAAFLSDCPCTRSPNSTF
jgi:hypothetical protein